MEKQRNTPAIIDLVACPGFCVKNSRIIQVNDAAKRLFLEPEMDICDLLLTGKEEYANFSGGCLYLSICLADQAQGALVTRIDDQDIFLVDADTELKELQLLALAAQELRTPLSNIMISADRLTPMQKEPKCQEQMARLNRGTTQLLRLVGNMSDALRYRQGCRLQLRNISALLEEIFEKAATLAQSLGVTLVFTGLQQDLYSLADSEQLERAVLNILSNALKFTPRGGTVDAVLTKKRNLLRLTIQDSGSGIGEGILQSIFSRYRRHPSLEDSRFGLGLGMVLIRTAAANHGGTVLIDQPDAGTRVTMTLRIQQPTNTVLHTKVLSFDYAGERDHALVELSETMPAVFYWNT